MEEGGGEGGDEAYDGGAPLSDERVVARTQPRAAKALKDLDLPPMVEQLPYETLEVRNLAISPSLHTSFARLLRRVGASSTTFSLTLAYGVHVCVLLQVIINHENVWANLQGSSIPACGASPTPHLRITASPHLRISASPHLRISASPHLRISASPHLRISASPTTGC